MPKDVEGTEQALDRSLSRMQTTLARLEASPMSQKPPLHAAGAAKMGGFLLALSAGSLALLAGTDSFFFVPIAIAFGTAGGMFLSRSLNHRRQSPGAPARIGMGATVASTAILEPGAIVEMGATVRGGAIIRSGAVVGMGSTVGANAIIESGAVVSWGATVKAGALVGANAVVGWGATVGKTVRVPAGTRLRPGSTVAGSWIRDLLSTTPPLPAPSFKSDPTEARSAAACERLASELRNTPEHLRGFLGVSEDTVLGLRRTCEDLSRREQAVRSELDPAMLTRLEEEKRALELRLAQETDERIRSSLEGAIAALDEQRRQRDLLRLSADRLLAERMRLVYTLEGLAAQFVRLRSAGAEAGRGPAQELEQGMKQLGAELDAISEALDHESVNPSLSSTRIRER